MSFPHEMLQWRTARATLDSASPITVQPDMSPQGKGSCTQTTYCQTTLKIPNNITLFRQEPLTRRANLTDWRSLSKDPVLAQLNGNNSIWGGEWVPCTMASYSTYLLLLLCFFAHFFQLKAYFELASHFTVYYSTMTINTTPPIHCAAKMINAWEFLSKLWPGF